jgi:signal transduction histidine kinase
MLELARPLPWLAAFGIAHGLNEWGYIFVPLQSLLLPDSAVRLMVIAHLLLLAISFFFLFQFGVELLWPVLSGRKLLGLIPLMVLFIWAGAVFLRGVVARDPLGTLFSIGDGWSRYLLCFPGSILAFLGLLRQARQVRAMDLSNIARYLTGAALAFLVYGVVGGLIVPISPVFPANVLNYGLLEGTIQVPAPVFRSLCGLAMALFLVRSLDIFQVETDRRIAEMEQAQILSADRERIGRDLHDGIIQKIYAAGLSLEDAHHLIRENPVEAQNRLQAVMRALNQTIQDIRSYIFDLQTHQQSHELETVLENLVQDLRLDTLLEVDLEVVGKRCCWLEEHEISHITQIAREALSNIVQHASASHVTVTLRYEGSATTLVIADNGHGLNPGPSEDNGNPGQGMANMRARARLLGASLQVRGRPGEGLQVALSLPCEARNRSQLQDVEGLPL